MMSITEEETKEVQNTINRFLDSYELFFFGSRVLGNPRENSDLDILIKSQTKIELSVLAQIKEAFDEGPLLFKVDVVDYYRVDQSFLDQIQNSLQQIN